VFGRVRMPSLGGATEWLNSESLGLAELGGYVLAREPFSGLAAGPPCETLVAWAREA
jgi:hypothetical protein